MKLLVGLGNPGDKYVGTRHNLGFQIIDQFLKDFESVAKTEWQKNEKLKSDIVPLTWQPKDNKEEKIILAKPLTYMNNSGMAVSLLVNYYKIEPENLWVIYDELDLPIGAMKIRFGGAAAGHHGVESIIAQLGTDKFWRFRMGIGPTQHHAGRLGREDIDGKVIGKRIIPEVEKYVLSSFGAKERSEVKALLKHGSESLQTALEKGLEAAMNRYNTK